LECFHINEIIREEVQGMKKGPDLVMVVVIVFVVGSVITGVFSQGDFQLSSMVEQVFSLR
jgi:hypothetical protein